MFCFFCTLELNYGALFVKDRFTQEVIEFNRRYIKKKNPNTNVEIQRKRAHLLFLLVVFEAVS